MALFHIKKPTHGRFFKERRTHGGLSPVGNNKGIVYFCFI
ncbi:MAG: hypothetical protein ACD_14C00020G0004 [uncultured bacterium]|nr:MAG: hypothetical protein ACD_14C00020G0004 [uncultured bacterium]